MLTDHVDWALSALHVVCDLVIGAGLLDALIYC